MRPGRVLSWLLRAPAALYSAHAGWLLGHRFLLLRHRGRSSHRLYSTVLEVVAWRPAAREAVVVSGFGRGSQWYRNLLAGQGVEVQIGRLRFAPEVRPLGAAAPGHADRRAPRGARPVGTATARPVGGAGHDGRHCRRGQSIVIRYNWV